jgi:hypothetical protein
MVARRTNPSHGRLYFDMRGTATKAARTLVPAFALVFLSAAPALAAKATVLTGYDLIARPGARATLRFKVERDNLIRWDIRGATVEFRWQGSLIGTAVSGDDGYADLAVRVGSTPGDYLITGKVAAGGEYWSREATLLLAIRDASARIVVTDIDWTLSAADWWEVATRSNSQIPPVNGAVAAIRDLAKDATVVYVTARHDAQSAKTKSWLATWGFPRAPVFFSEDVRAFFDPRPYKTAVVRSIEAAFPSVLCGFGDLTSDAEAYHANGLPAFIFDTHGAGPFPSYAIVYPDWVALRAANAAGRRPELAWATSFR